MTANSTCPVTIPSHATRLTLIGLSLLTLGTLALLDRQQLVALPLLRTFWPLLLVWWGSVLLLTPRAGRRWRLFPGAALIAAGSLITAQHLGLLPLRPFWPVLLVAAGVLMLARALRAGRASASM
ncbi:MAG: hypothetical protein RJA44_746 [Pseudomonadota bacterium]